MTREEAIKEVNKAFEPAFANYIITALGEGATVSDRCEDAVSRKAVGELCFRFLKANSDDNIAFYEHFLDLPSVTPTQKWIPCSERFPKENVKVLTQDYDGDIQVDWLFDLELRWFYSQHHIVAWMPLPKPYKAKMESEDGK